MEQPAPGASDWDIELFIRRHTQLVALRVPKSLAVSVRNVLSDNGLVFRTGSGSRQSESVDFALNYDGSRLALQDDAKPLFELFPDSASFEIVASPYVGKAVPEQTAAKEENRRFTFCELFAGVGGL